MSTTRTIFAIVAASLLCPSIARADVGLWLEAGVRVQVTDRVDFGVAQHLRFEGGNSQVSAVMPEAGLELDVNELLELGVGYRYEYERRDDELEGAHRVHADGTVSVDVGLAKVSYRLRGQDRVSEEGGTRVRNRLAAKLRLPLLWNPAASIETFHELSGGSTEWDKTRITAGVELEIWEQDVQSFYRIDVPRDPMAPIVHIVGLELTAKVSR